MDDKLVTNLLEAIKSDGIEFAKKILLYYVVKDFIGNVLAILLMGVSIYALYKSYKDGLWP